MYGEYVNRKRRILTILSFIKTTAFARQKLIDNNDFFLIFHEDDGEKRTSSQTCRREQTKQRCVLRIPVGMIAGGGMLDSYLNVDSWQPDPAVPGGWHESEDGDAKEERNRKSGRFVQFCFARTWFAMDLPNVTLSVFDALRLQNECDGFFRNADVDDFRISSPRQIKRYDPVCKYYEYDQYAEAAADTYFILWDLWALPPRQPLFATADSWDNRIPPLLNNRPIRW